MSKKSLTNIQKEDEALWDDLTLPGAEGPICAWCQRRQAVCLHEITPKSLAPGWWWERDNRLPVCNECHQYLQSHRHETENLQRTAQRRALERAKSWSR